MHEYQFKILKLLKKKGETNIEKIMEATDLGRDAIMWAVEGLIEKKATEVALSKTVFIEITEEGKKYLSEFPEEALVKKLVKNKKLNVTDIKNKIGLMWAKRNRWISITGKYVQLTNEGLEFTKNYEYALREVLSYLGPRKEIPEEYFEKHKKEISVLIKRKLLLISEKRKINRISITRLGKELLEQEAKEEGIGQLTKEIIVSGLWKKEKFKKYNINAPVEEQYAARLHPIHEFINYIRNLWLNMGFVEVSGPIIESAFWDFDVLFSPQDHPTREMQDTFFLSNPKQIDIEDLTLLNRVKEMHLSSWGDVWREELSKQALLRTHTTSISAHYIYKFSKMLEADYPVKLFSIGKVFRNESIDYKHLAELTQYDGIIIGDNLNFANLISTLSKFYESMGLDTDPKSKEFRFKPAYFPFVEPGLEALYYDKEKKEWIELIGGGIIRKEITRALGINKTVLAWGGGVERLLFRFMNLDSLTRLYKNNIQWLRKREPLHV